MAIGNIEKKRGEKRRGGAGVAVENDCIILESPELNSVEQVWQQLRDNWLANRCFDGYETIVNACCSAWNWFVDMPGRIRKLCTREWAIFNFIYENWYYYTSCSGLQSSK